MTTITTDTALAETLVRLSRVVQSVFADVARHNDLTPQQTHLLCVLRNGPVGMGQLGRLLHLEKSSLTGLIDRLEQRGLVTRVRDDRDRRALHVTLTSHGARLSRRSHNQVTARLQALTTGLAEPHTDQVTSTLEQLIAAYLQPGSNGAPSGHLATQTTSHIGVH